MTGAERRAPEDARVRRRGGAARAALSRAVSCCAVLCRAVPCCAVLRRTECAVLVAESDGRAQQDDSAGLAGAAPRTTQSCIC